MSDSDELYTLYHRIPPKKLAAEKRKIEAALKAGGYNERGLDLLAIAVSAIRRDLYLSASNLGIRYSCFWEPAERASDGEEIVFMFEDETQAAAFKITVL